MCVYTHTHTHIYIYIYDHTQDTQNYVPFPMIRTTLDGSRATADDTLATERH